MRRVRTVLAALLCLFLAWERLPGAALADDGKAKSQSERNQDRARALREKATDAAKAQTGYETVFEPGAVADPDTYYSLSLQIERLAGMVQALRKTESQREAGASFRPIVPAPPGPGSLSDVRSVYGPDGPTEKSVRLLLEYRLMVAGNPRLKIGKIGEDGARVTAQVVTVDGSLVDEYVVDKKTGAWRPVR